MALLARGQDGLDALASGISGARAYAYDATDADGAQAVFAAIRRDLGPPRP